MAPQGPAGPALDAREPGATDSGRAQADRGEADRGEAERWADLPAGAALFAAIDGVEPRALDADELIQLAQAHSRMIAHHEAGLTEALAALTRRPIYGYCRDVADHAHDRARAAADEVSLAMRWSPRYADSRVRSAIELVEFLPATLEALSAGHIDAYRANVIADETHWLSEDPELRRQVEADALAVAGERTGAQLRAFVKRAVVAAAPEAAEQRRTSARKARRVDKPFVGNDGMGSLSLFGPVEDLAALYTAVDAAARARRDAARTAGEASPDAQASLDELRFDVLTGLGWSGLAAGHLGCCSPECPGASHRLGTTQGRPASIQVTVPLSTLIGIDEQPAELHGYGPITAGVARKIAADGTWRRLLTDPRTGALLEYGTRRYTPPQDLRDFIIARDRTCRFPTCTWPAESSQLDHTIPHRPDGTGGPTAPGNLGAWHDRHHDAKTRHGWTYRQPQPGVFVITSPAGLTYRVDPEVIGQVIEFGDGPGPPSSAPPTQSPP